MDALALIAYGFYLALILVGGLAAVRSRNLVRALLGLILTLFGVAGMYFLMAAPFMALMQILIYVGAVSVLIAFAVMLAVVLLGISIGGLVWLVLGRRRGARTVAACWTDPDRTWAVRGLGRDRGERRRRQSAVHRA